MSSETPFISENLDFYLKALAKEYRKLGGKTMRAEIVLIGGASILASCGFWEMTYDMDAIINASSAMTDAIRCVTDLYDLPNGWLNADFVRTSSYTPKLIEHSTYYKTFSGILTVRTVTAEYLIAMKLKSGRLIQKRSVRCRGDRRRAPEARKGAHAGRCGTCRAGIVRIHGMMYPNMPASSLSQFSKHRTHRRFTGIPGFGA